MIDWSVKAMLVVLVVGLSQIYYVQEIFAMLLILFFLIATISLVVFVLYTIQKAWESLICRWI